MDDDQNGAQATETPVATNEVSEADAEEKAAATEENAKTETDSAEDDPSEGGNDDEAEDDPQPRRKSGIQRLKERNARLEAELMQLRSRGGDSGDLRSAIERDIGQPPRESDFPDYLAFERAMTAYTVKAAIAEERARERASVEQIRQQERVRELVETYEDRQIEARKAIPDYDAVLKSAKNVAVAPHVEGLILESDKSALLAYHLAKRPEQVERLNALPPVFAAREIGRLEARLSLPNPNRETKAPPPVKPVRGAATPTDSDKEIEAWMAKTYGKNRR